MTRDWRLVGGDELYNIRNDPGQREHVAAQYPEVRQRLRDEHERWWSQIEPGLHDDTPIVLGNAAENPTRLDAMDVMGDVVWNQTAVAAAMKCSGIWTVEIDRPGCYAFSLRRWPEELDIDLDATIPDQDAQNLAPYLALKEAGSVAPVRAGISLLDQERQIEIAGKAKEASIELHLDTSGKTVLQAWFDNQDGTRMGAYYVYVERMEERR